MQVRGGLVEGREDHAGVGVDLGRGDQADALAVQPLLTAVGVLVERHASQFAAVGVGPRMVGAAEVGGVAQLRPAHLHAAVQAHVEEHLDRAGFVADDDEGVVHDATHDVVAGIGDLRFVGQEHPRPAEHASGLQRVDLRIGVDRRGDQPTADVVEDRLQVHGHIASGRGTPQRALRAP